MRFKLYLMSCVLSLFTLQLTIASDKPQSVIKEDITRFLTEDLEQLYSVTYSKLISRMDSSGYLPESLTGAYKGMYPRTVGAYALLMIETERYSKAEIALKYILDAMKDNEEIFVPHVVGNEGNDNGGRANIIDDQYQSDAHAHVILGWARLASARGITQFERDTWPQVKALMNRLADRTLFQYGSWSIEPGLLRAVTFEHSRDGRMWDAYDLLTQSLFGAALSEMAKIADTMGEIALASTWREKERILSEGINKNLVVERDGQQTYAEMFIPNGNGGTPYMGMGWVCFSPVAAGWEGVDHSVLRNTMGSWKKTICKQLTEYVGCRQMYILMEFL
ncbi:MAG: hypothetical protein PHH37_12645 [Paludibacter sp.]|nr:hypothetical protein [Paludibacter sp.]